MIRCQIFIPIQTFKWLTETTKLVLYYIFASKPLSRIQLSNWNLIFGQRDHSFRFRFRSEETSFKWLSLPTKHQKTQTIMFSVLSPFLDLFFAIVFLFSVHCYFLLQVIDPSSCGRRARDQGRIDRGSVGTAVSGILIHLSSLF